jgi:hypothetical protein
LTVEGGDGNPGELPDVGGDDPLVGHAEIFAEIGGVAIAAAFDELGGDHRRRMDLVGEDGRLVVGDDPVDRSFQAAPLSRDEDRVVPRLLELGEGVLDRADVGDEFEGFGGKVAQQVAADAEEERIARGEDHRLAAAPLQVAHQLGRIAADIDLLTGEFREQGELAGASVEDFGPLDEFADPGTEPFLAFDSGSNHVNLFHRHHPSSPPALRRPPGAWPTL